MVDDVVGGVGGGVYLVLLGDLVVQVALLGVETLEPLRAGATLTHNGTKGQDPILVKVLEIQMLQLGQHTTHSAIQAVDSHHRRNLPNPNNLNPLLLDKEVPRTTQ